MSSEITVLGACGFEIFAVSKYFKPQKEDTQNNISFAHGSQLWLDNAIHEPGGNALVAAITCARQGVKTNIISVIGRDSLGLSLKKIAKQEEIDTTHLIENAAHHTDLNLHLTYQGHDETTFHYPGSFLSLDKKSLPSSLIGWLHIATLPPEKSVLLTLKKILKNHKGGISIHPRFVHALPTRVLSKILHMCDLVFFNRDEASIYLGGFFSIEEAAIKLYQSGLKNCVVYDGKNGCALIHNDTLYLADSYTKDKALDITGAEDSFSGGYISALLTNRNIIDALTLAIAQADSVMGIIGSRAGILQNPVLKQLNVKKSNLNQ